MGFTGFEIRGLDDLINVLDSLARGEILQAIAKAMEQLGEALLREAQKRTPIDTGLLWHSLQRGHPQNLWQLDLRRGVVRLTLGTDVDYALFIEQGHWTNPQGVPIRWVPGYWLGDRFIYDPTSDTGMALKQQWVPGAHMFEIAFEEIERLAPDFLDRVLEEVFDRAAKRIRA